MKRLLLSLFALLIWASAAFAQSTQQCVSSALAGGTGDAITTPLLPCSSTTNLLLLTLTATNATTSPTLQPVGQAALPILNYNQSAPSIGQLASGSVVLLTPTGTSWLILGPIPQSLTGPAGGDLGGNYPNPTVLSGTHLSGTLAPGLTAPGLIVTGSLTATGLVSNADLANSSMTVATRTCTLGSACTIAVSNLSDVTAPATWTPVDASGQSLSITVNAAYYYKVGKECIVTMDITYPSTANGATAAIGGLPCTADASAGADVFEGSFLTSASQAANALINGSGNINFVVLSTGALWTNANASSARFRGTIVLFTS